MNRSWVILRNEGGNLWRQVTAIVAPTRKAAVDQATKGEHPYTQGMFKAIPSQEWGHLIEVGPTPLRQAARDLAEAVRAHDPELISNDLGNALDAVEELL